MFFVFASNFGMAQRKCTVAMSEADFSTSKRAIASVSSMVQRMNRCQTLVQSNCLSVSQLKDLLEFFPEDADRLQLSQAALPNITNRADVYEVMNSFAYFSTAFKFYELIGAKPLEVQTPVQPAQPAARPQLEFPPLNYPSAETYNGKKNCAVFLSDADFVFLAQKIVETRDENHKFALAKDIATKNCLSTAQGMKLASLLKLEKDRLDLLKGLMPTVYDEGNFSQAVALFAHQPNRQEFSSFVASFTQPVAPVPVSCVVTDAQQQQLVSTLKNQPSSFDRLAIAKNMIPASKCYSSNQIKEVVALFPSSTDKLEIAKFCYDYTTDTQNFFATVSPLIPSQFDRRALSNYITSKQR